VFRKTASGRAATATAAVAGQPRSGRRVVAKAVANGQGEPRRDPARTQSLDASWNIHFDTASGGPSASVVFTALQDWSKNSNPGIRYYSGTAVYTQTFEWAGAPTASAAKGAAARTARVWLDLGRVADLAQVSVNGVDCGVAWTAPYRVEITKAVHPGENQLRIEVTNTWANRLIGDHGLPPAQRITWTTAPYRLDGKLLEAGLLGPVTMVTR
jgi:hypothetical protein